MISPDYNSGSLVNLMASIGQAAGMSVNAYEPLQSGALSDLEQYQNIVLFVVDGLGYNYLKSRSRVLKPYLDTSMTSVFPSTTASSITTFMTGQAPLQHGLTGWHVYFEELDAITAVLPYTIRGQGIKPDMQLDALYQHTPIFDQLKINSAVLSPDWIIDTDYNCAHQGRAQAIPYNDLSSMFKQLTAYLTSSYEQNYMYAYWPDFDRLAHTFGIDSLEVTSHFLELESYFDELFEEISETSSCIIVTADHGFLDRNEKVIHLHEHPRLLSYLAMPLCGEPRAAYCYVKKNKQSEFISYIENELSEYIDCFKSTDLVDMNMYGTGTPHPQIFNRIGDYTLVMKSNYIIKDRLSGEGNFIPIGVHGGVSEDEMYVPLIIHKTRN